MTQNPDALQIAIKKLYLVKIRTIYERRTSVRNAICFYIFGEDHPSEIERINNIETWKPLLKKE